MKPLSYIKPLLPFWLFVLFFKFGAGLHYTLLSVLGARVLPIWIVGLCIGSAAIFQLILDVPIGFLLDRLGYMKLLRLGTFAFLIGITVFFFGLTPFTFLITLFFSECGWLIFGPGTNAYVLSKTPKNISGKYLGFFHTIMALGTVLASATLTFIMNKNIITIASVLISLLAIALCFALLTPPESVSVHEEKKTPRHFYYIRRHFLHHTLASLKKLNPASTLLVLQTLAGSLFYGSIWFVIPLILANDTQQGMLGLSLGIFDFAIVLLGSFLGKLADKYHQKRLVLLGLLLFTGAGSFIGFHLNIWFFVLGFLATAGDEMSSVSLWAWLDRLDRKHNEDGLVSGTIFLFEDLGWTIGPILAGFLFIGVGPAWTIALCSTPIFLTWIASIVLLNKHHKPTFSQSKTHLDTPHRLRHKH